MVIVCVQNRNVLLRKVNFRNRREMAKLGGNLFFFLKVVKLFALRIETLQRPALILFNF